MKFIPKFKKPFDLSGDLNFHENKSQNAFRIFMGPFLNFPFPRLNPNPLAIILWGIAQIDNQSCIRIVMSTRNVTHLSLG